MQTSEKLKDAGTVPAARDRHPGDEAAPGTPQTGEAVCPQCGGSAVIRINGRPVECDYCGATGYIIQNVGDA